MSAAEFHIEELRVHGLTWQIILQAWGPQRAESMHAFASARAQLEAMSYADAVRVHEGLLRADVVEVPRPNGGPPLQFVEVPPQVLLIQRHARRAALDWPRLPIDTHTIHIGAIPS